MFYLFIASFFKLCYQFDTLRTFQCFLQITISANLSTIVGGWGWTDLIFKLPAARLKVLNIKVIDWYICKWIYRKLQKYHLCAGGEFGVFNQGPCFVKKTI
jgi:hypothetical protein